VSPRITLAVAVRVLEQLRRDPRTIGLVLAVPCVLMLIVKGAFEHQAGTFERVGPPMLGLFPLIIMFLITSITMLRERTTGTLERLMTMPMSKLDLLAGYGIAFALIAAVQAAVTSAFAYLVLGLDTEGSAFWVGVLAVSNALLGTSLGLLLSAFARTEFQAVQFMPAFILPQILLCGLLVPREEMARALDVIAGGLPLTYAYDALARVAAGQSFEERLVLDVAIVVGVTMLALVLGAATLRRRTA
jgi:ABC-2 type transport system permease protein